jgi:epoxyqueuosine reductase
VRIAGPDSIPLAPERLRAWLEAGHHGSMDWMQETAGRRSDPRALWPEVRSVILLGLNYGPTEDPLAALARKDCGSISVYARNRDYHDVIKGKLKEAAGFLAARAGSDVKVFVDTAPVMEKPLAEAAGLGWQGKHTVIVSREFGNWLFLGAIFTTAELPADAPERDHCGSCRRCLDVCPTDAFPAPYQLDARRCISYLTIEHRGPVDESLRASLDGWAFGCDVCQEVCPWNRKAPPSREPAFAGPGPVTDLAGVLGLDAEAFRDRFRGTAIWRAGRSGLLRNAALVLAGRAASAGEKAALASAAGDSDPVIRDAAEWALRRLSARS